MSEDHQAIVNGCFDVMLGHSFCENRLHIPGNPAGVIVIMDHQVHQDAAGFDFVEEPVAGWLLGTVATPVQSDHTRPANLSLDNGGPCQGIFWKETDHMGNQ